MQVLKKANYLLPKIFNSAEGYMRDTYIRIYVSWGLEYDF